MNPLYLQIMGGVGAYLMLAAFYAYIMPRLGVRIQLRPLSIKIVEPSGRIRMGFVQVIEKRMKKNPPIEAYTVHVHKQLMRMARNKLIEAIFFFFIFNILMISSWGSILFKNGN